MFNPNQTEVRNFFFTLMEKVSLQQELTGLEKIAYSIILEHPEYQGILNSKTKYLDFTWTPEMGQVNPFLHLSMHLTIIEQLSINQPVGIKPLYAELCDQAGDEHQAQHELMDCIAEMLWQAQYSHNNPDATIYFKCIMKKLGKESD
ncbi:MAG: DUF1841 family protein [Burkholderiales bacterium]